jgi:NAD(P)-dependent dehydrogenase (short-subunit alcohol dehydrogenase family)
VSAARAGWDPRNIPSQHGRVYLVTGANAGLGFFSSEQLARAGAHVIMSGRNPKRLAAARAALIRRVQGASVESLLLDTSNLGSVRAASATVGARQRLDGVLLNAGIVHPPAERTLTRDGVEIVFATNVLGHFALAGSLLPALRRASGGRMVWLGSMSTSMWRYRPEDPQLERGYTPWRAYVQSKVATQALGLEADRRLRAAGVPVASVIAHPGYSVGGRTAGIPGVNTPSRLKRFGANLQAPITQSKEHGAWAPVRALTDPAAAGGSAWGPGWVMKGMPRPARVAPVSRDEAPAAELWSFCEQTAGVRWP